VITSMRGPRQTGAVRVVVLGGGISGLTCAQRLLEAGNDVAVVTADRVQDTTSHLAAAVWFPTAAGPPDAVARWGAATFDELARQADDAVPGVRMCESLVLQRAVPAAGEALPTWADAVGEVRAARADELPPGYAAGLRFAVPLVEMPLYLPHLLADVLGRGADLVERHIDSLVELLDLRPDVVVNAAGIAAAQLVGDATVYPVRGQIVRVVNPGLTLSVRDEHHPGGRAYVHPRSRDAILGGTLEQGRWDTDPDPDETAAILRRCTDIVPALDGAEVIETVAGLRPGRRTVRLEVDETLLPVPVIHDYGHGGAGITLGWGCADDVTAIIGLLADRDHREGTP
jgi:D-amino-acid oxidase